VQEPLPDFQTLLAALDAHAVRYSLIDGLAMTCHGSAYLTDTCRLVYARDPENLAAIVAALAPLKPRLRGTPEGLPFRWDRRTLQAGANFTLVTDAADMDLLGFVPGVESFENLFSRAVEMELFGLAVRVASVDDLIAMKRAANRPKDPQHLLELEALRKLAAEEGGETWT